MMSSVSRASSPCGSAEGAAASALGAGAASGDGLLPPPELCSARRSCEETLRLDQGLRKPVHLGARVVKAERGPAGGGHPETSQQRHHAMGAGAHRDTGAVDDGRDIVGMGALELEGNNRALVLGGAEDAQRVDLAQALVRVADEGSLVRADARSADRIDVVDGGAKPDRLYDRRR